MYVTTTREFAIPVRCSNSYSIQIRVKNTDRFQPLKRVGKAAKQNNNFRYFETCCETMEIFEAKS